MKKENLEGIQQLLATPKRVVITAHRNPDGDAVGSSLGLAQYLISQGHNVHVVLPNEYPDFLKWLPGQELVSFYETETEIAQQYLKVADVIFTLDFNHRSRVGDAMTKELTDTNAVMIMIDHHEQPDAYAKYMYSDTSMSSTCEMAYHFIDKLGDTDQITPEIANCLYTGIMTDTGSFRYRSTTALTHAVVAELIRKGAQNTSIHENIYDTNSLSRLKLQSIALSHLKVFKEYGTAYTYLSQKDLNSCDYRKGDTEGFVNIGLSIQGIRFAAIFIENEQEQIVKISLRSKGDFSVNQVARTYFDGGGHKNAAGGRSTDSLQETLAEFENLLPELENELCV